jgi:hypothetical protein
MSNAYRIKQVDAGAEFGAAAFCGQCSVVTGIRLSRKALHGKAGDGQEQVPWHHPIGDIALAHRRATPAIQGRRS